MQLLHLLDDERGLVLPVPERARDRVGPLRSNSAQRLLGAAEPRHEPVREREHRRRRAVVRLQPDDAASPGQQVGGRRAREAVDRLVVVADHAQVVPVAEPELEQRLLEVVHVLVFVDGEGLEPRLEPLARRGVLLEQADGELEHVLEVEQASFRLPVLVLAVDAFHQVGRDRRGMVAERAPVLGGADPAVLGALDLGRQVGGGPEAKRLRERVRDLAEHDDLGRENAGRRLGREPS